MMTHLRNSSRRGGLMPFANAFVFFISLGWKKDLKFKAWEAVVHLGEGFEILVLAPKFNFGRKIELLSAAATSEFRLTVTHSRKVLAKNGERAQRREEFYVNFLFLR